tara:strand:- start:787 stop:1116 length:330 start_codon:yes stop_codon:yes gene_type:complete
MEKLFLLLVATAFLVSCDQAPKEAPINPKMDVFNTNVASTKAFLSSFMENDSITFFPTSISVKMQPNMLKESLIKKLFELMKHRGHSFLNYYIYHNPHQGERIVKRASP